MEKQKKSKFRIILKSIKKRVKFSHILILSLLLVGNTYAWFIYATKVNNDVDVHVRSWQILFSNNNTPVADYVNVVVDDVYPGMDDFTDSLVIQNMSDVNASITYSILSARILDTEIVTVEGALEEDENADITGLMTSAELESALGSDYPFIIDFSVTSEEMDAEIGQSNFTSSVVWDYESGHDDEDTFWGNSAYTYKLNNPDSSCIQLRIKLFITQSLG